jgi:hypothetical protein
MMAAMSGVTQILDRIQHGDWRAAEELLPLIYNELRRLAAHHLSREKPGQTLQPTALVHEAYLRLVGGEDQKWNGRAHFFAAAAQAMRRIVIEAARRKNLVESGDAVAGKTLVGVDPFSCGVNAARVATFIGEWNDGGPDGLGFQRALFRTDGVIAAALGDVIDGNQITVTFDSSSINDFRDVAWGGHFDTALGSWLDNFLGVFRLTQAEQAMPPGALVPYLRALVDSLSLSSGIRATLDAKLDDIYASYLANRPNAVTDLNGVINYVEAQTGKGITQADADRIILGARAILLRVK